MPPEKPVVPQALHLRPVVNAQGQAHPLNSAHTGHWRMPVPVALPRRCNPTRPAWLPPGVSISPPPYLFKPFRSSARHLRASRPLQPPPPLLAALNLTQGEKDRLRESPFSATIFYRWLWEVFTGGKSCSYGTASASDNRNTWKKRAHRPVRGLCLDSIRSPEPMTRPLEKAEDGAVSGVRAVRFHRLDFIGR
jgi:hypothetical protein